MKTYIPYSLILAAAATGLAVGQTQTAYTTPVGYVSLGDTTTGQPAIKAGTDVTFSIPLNRPTEFAGAVASTTSNSISFSGTPFTASQWVPNASTPYLVAVTSGAQNGFVGLISANTTNSITVTPVTGGSLTSVVATDKIKIFKAWTLISLFPAGTFPGGVRVFGYTGTASGINIAPDLNYLTNGTNWTRSGVAANDTILYTGESFFIRTTTTAIPTLAISGEVPTARSRTFIDKNSPTLAQDTRLGYVSPVDEIIGDSGLGAVLTPGDRLFAFNNNASGINKAPTENLLWNGTNWTLSGNTVTNTYTLKGGRGYYVRRPAAAAAGSVDWVDTQSYIPSL